MVNRSGKSDVVHIPVNVLYDLDIQPGDDVEIWGKNDCIVIQKSIPNCSLCGSSSEAIEFNYKLICFDCLSELDSINKFLTRGRRQRHGR